MFISRCSDAGVIKPKENFLREQLMDHLFKNYQKYEIPGVFNRTTTVVTVYMTITEITSIDVRMMDYTTYLLLRQEWQDPRLAWNHIPYFRNYTKSLSSPKLKDQLWLPDLFFRNGKEGRIHQMTLPNYLTRISPDGNVLYSQKITMRFSCQMDLKTFPMDAQTCHINIGSVGYSVNELRFIWRANQPIELVNGMQIAEFSSPERVEALDCNEFPTDENSSCLTATFVLSRQLGSWFSSVYITNFLIVIASWHSFWVDIEAQPARVSLGLLTLLGLITQASGISANLPRVSYIKAIDVWNIACITFNVSVLIEFAVASNMRTNPGKQPEKWRLNARDALRAEVEGWCIGCRKAFIQRQKKARGGSGSDLETALIHAIYPDVASRANLFPNDVLQPDNLKSRRDESAEKESSDNDSEIIDLGQVSDDGEGEDVEEKKKMKPKRKVSKIDVYSRYLQTYKPEPTKMLPLSLLLPLAHLILAQNNETLGAANSTSMREQIMDYLFENYQKHERPGAAIKEPTVVIVYITVTAITSVDVRMMEYTADMMLRQEWRDVRLGWDKHPIFKQYNKNLVAPQLKSELWLPDLFFRNGKEGRLHKMTLPNYLIRISPDGNILYSQKITMRFSCQMDLANFPMDSQDCNMNIGSYGYEYSELQFVWRNDTPVSMSPGMQISEFNSPENVISYDCSAESSTSTGNYTCLELRFTLSRELGSWLSSVYIPNFLIIIASWHSFWVDLDAKPARVTLGLLTLLSILTQASGVSSSLPRVSYIKAIDVWNIACIIFDVGVLIEFTIASHVARRIKTEDWKDDVRNAVRHELSRWCTTCQQVFYQRGPSASGIYLSSAGYPEASPRKYIDSANATALALKRGKLEFCEEMERVLIEVFLPEEMSKSRIFPTDIAQSKADIQQNMITTDSLNAALLPFEEDHDFPVPKSDELPTRKPKKISEIDGYSRFLFPACFTLYNCFYWLYYLVLVNEKK
nr:Cys loop ligand gated ion channel subunit [Hymenolepis microstoma]